MHPNRQLTDLLSELFGFPKFSSGAKDIEYNCPKCDQDRNKFNLSVDVNNKIFQCWACGYKGRAIKLFYDYGSPIHIERYKSLDVNAGLKLQKNNSLEKEAEQLTLSDFRSLKHQWTDSLNYVAAMKYLSRRNIDQTIIDRWDMCYAETGKYKNRIIVPSKSEDGKIDYFIARDFFDTQKAKYFNPQLDKEKIIFGEKFIDWKKPIFITEGVFDAVVIYNAIPILGTNLKPYKRLIQKLSQNRSTVILGFDPDDVGVKKEINVAKFLLNIGCTVYILPKKLYNGRDLSKIYQDEGKSGIVTLIKSAEEFDELDAAIANL